MARIDITVPPIALSAQAADRLFQRGNGDAALLYLYILRNGGEYDAAAAQRALGWNIAQVTSALAHLREMELVIDNAPPERVGAPKAEDCPAYSMEDIAAELNHASPFRAMVDEVETLFGRKLSQFELRILMELYHHLCLPTEVIALLVSYQLHLTQASFGPGRAPRISEIKSMAYRWKKNGIETLENADAWIRRQEYLRSQEGALLQAVGVRGREAVPAERRYLHQWSEWGFGADAVSRAYEATMLHTGTMKWPYCNAILRRWHEKKAHTLAEIDAIERPASQHERSRTQGAPSRNDSDAQNDAVRASAAWMRQVLAQEETETR